MSRGLLDDSDWQNISRKTPNLDNLWDIILHLSPDILSVKFPSKNIPVASVCLRDTLDTLGEARYALSEVFAHRIWYLEKENPPNEMAFVFFGRFYADDAALRLYSAAEHLANGIIMMLEITDKDLKPYKKKRSSQQLIVGHFLKEQKPHHPITKAVTKLVDSKEWSETMKYRRSLVHEQPPTVGGLEIVYKRRRRWEASPIGKGYTLHIGGGDIPEYSSVDKLVGFIQPAMMFQFSEALTSITNFYIDLLKSWGISIT